MGGVIALASLGTVLQILHIAASSILIEYAQCEIFCSNPVSMPYSRSPNQNAAVLRASSHEHEQFSQERVYQSFCLGKVSSASICQIILTRNNKLTRQRGCMVSR